VVLQQVQHTLSASVGHGDAFVAVGIPPNLTHCSKTSVLRGLYRLHYFCSEVNAVRLSPFLQLCSLISPIPPNPILMFRLALPRLALLIVVISICPCLHNVGNRVPVAYRLRILLMGGVSN
jgi:hypothetical protein